jgi:AcrR family transcriptional regulator
MSATRHSAKGEAKREEILEAALRIVAEKGYNGATIRTLADSVGLSKTGLLHHFGNKEDLFVEILRRRDAADVAALQRSLAEGRSLPESVAGVLERNAQVPGLVQLYSRFAMEVSDPSQPAHQYFADRYQETQRWLEDYLREAAEDGRLPQAADPERLATIIVALSDGLQMRWMFDPDIDMGSHLQYLFEALGVGSLRE